MLEKLMEILAELRPDVDFTKEKALITEGILDSFDIVSLVRELSDAFEVEIRVENLLPENFNSVEGMMKLLQTLQDEE